MTLRSRLRGIPAWSIIARASRAPLLWIIPGICALLWEPTAWLVRTWWDPSWDSEGAFAAAAVALLLVASVKSGPRIEEGSDATLLRRDRTRAVSLLVVTALIRVLGRVLDVHVLGAAALAVDVTALAYALGLARRPLALSPVALGALFAFALPLESVLQRVLGHPMRIAGAVLAEVFTRVVVPAGDVVRDGALLHAPGVDVYVDLPCSGAQGLVFLAAFAAFVACFLALSARRALVVAVCAVAGGVVVNGARIAALFLGARASLDVWSEPWHSVIGLLALALGTAPLFIAVRGARRRAPVTTSSTTLTRARPATSTLFASRAACASFTIVALAVAAAPHHPLDVDVAMDRDGARAALLPIDVAGFQSVAEPLSDLEARYYRTYGGRAEKRRYTDASGRVTDVVAVKTSSPLRHLHGPERCLAGAGYDVERAGVIEVGVPSVVFRVTSGTRSVLARDVRATYVRDDGQLAVSDAEAAWSWLKDPSHAWLLVERIRGRGACDVTDCTAFDRTLVDAVVHGPSLVATGEHR